MAVVLCTLLATPSAFAASTAQKIGVVDYGKIFQMMPETKAAEQNITASRSQTNAELGKQQAALQNAIQAYQKGGKQNAATEKSLRTQEEAFRKTVAEKQELLAKKEQELVAPIKQKIDTAIETVAKSEGVNLVFDKSVRVYGDAESDLTFKVIDKLNIK